MHQVCFAAGSWFPRESQKRLDDAGFGVFAGSGLVCNGVCFRVRVSGVPRAVMTVKAPRRSA